MDLEEESSHSNTEVDNSLSTLISSEMFPMCITKNTALLFLKMKSQYCLADSTVQSIIGDYTDCFDITSLSLKHQIKEICQKYFLPDGAFIDLCGAADNGSFNSAMSQLSSDWKRNAYYKRVFPYVAPGEYKFKKDCVFAKESFKYISIIETLTMLLKNENIRTQIMNPES
jgi:hypothetical protein